MQAFVQTPGPEAMPLHQEVSRHVHAVSRPYPDAYFALGRKTEDALEALGAACSRSVRRSRRDGFRSVGGPLRAFSEEQMEGRAMRYHTFYAKISITREVLRDDYARNITRDPILRWRADLYRQVGEALKACASRTPWIADAPPGLPASGPASSGARYVVVELAGDAGGHPDLVRIALEHGGAITQSRLSTMLEGVLPAPSIVEPDAAVEQAPDMPTA